MNAVVRCPNRHALADVEATSGGWRVSPRRLQVYRGDDRHRKSLTTEGLPTAEWHLRDEVPQTIDVLVCPCGEFFYPEDLATQLRARRRVVIAIPL